MFFPGNRQKIEDCPKELFSVGVRNFVQIDPDQKLCRFPCEQ